MISTQNYAALPDATSLQQLSKALAVLDAINWQEWDGRYYSYDASWSEDGALLAMRNGSGDDMMVLFRAEGCCINGHLHEYDQPDKAQVTRGLPAAFDEFIFGEPVKSLGTTFCLWYTPARGWQTGVVENPDDGSAELLPIFDGNPATYAEWATEYYTEDTERAPITTQAVAPVYEGKTLTRSMVLAINEELDDWAQLETDLQEIGYPYDFATAS
ncbi:hypothetical protein [Hymenobacter cellulosilyticus]|uniref:Uncharacterized protein n=1 Tax=Hymenobacter cellulosilyticus TaxID=2932248 RepID=A0A8T9QE73_9BACT|nr:hypothetical protein [Hymenobacter cellulosilyticus]UOQ74448.1 hypothetical protein MUN79_11540 [Hymenobacter cellulosilyticus]